MLPENLEITLHDTLTLNTYSAKVELKQQYIPLLLKWLSKRKFSVVEQALENTVSLRCEMFTFHLVQRLTSEKDLLNILGSIRAER